MFAQFQHVYAEINDKDEIAIAEKYGYSARRYTTLLASKRFILFLHNYISNLINALQNFQLKMYMHFWLAHIKQVFSS